jgi:hypothetical protein
MSIITEYMREVGDGYFYDIKYRYIQPGESQITVGYVEFDSYGNEVSHDGEICPFPEVTNYYKQRLFHRNEFQSFR